jgi:hypothetical protein
VGSFVFSLDKVFLFCRVTITVATLPSALSMSDLFARCKLGILVSAGAANKQEVAAFGDVICCARSEEPKWKIVVQKGQP